MIIKTLCISIIPLYSINELSAKCFEFFRLNYKVIYNTLIAIGRKNTPWNSGFFFLNGNSFICNFTVSPLYKMYMLLDQIRLKN